MGFSRSELNLLDYADIEKQRAWFRARELNLLNYADIESGELGFVRSTEPRMIGKLRSRNDLNAMSRRSSSDLVSLSSFLRSSSAFRLAGLKIGSHLLPFGSHTPFASGGSV